MRRPDSYTDLSVLQEDYTPNKLVDRTEQKQELREAVNRFQDSELRQHLYLTGSPGTGKTETARKALKDREYVEVNCFVQDTTHQIMVDILHQAGKRIGVYREGTSTSHVKHKLYRYAEQNQLIIFLDEIDKLSSEDAFYTLFNLPNTLLIAAGNTSKNMVFNDQRVKSRFQKFKELKFPQYSREELKEILRRRCENAHIEEEESSVSKLVKHPEVNDPRVGMAVIQETVEMSEGSSLSETDMRHAIKELDRAVEETREEELKEHQKLLLEIIREEDKIRSGDLYEEYREQAEQPKSERTLRNYLGDLDNRGLIEKSGVNRHREYRTVRPDSVEETEEPAVA
jgi:cell division control protein 6